MAERDVVEAVEHLRPDRTRSADRKRALRLALRAALHEGMGDHDRAPPRHPRGAHRSGLRGERGVVVGDRFVAAGATYQGRFRIGQRMDLDLAVGVAQHQRRGIHLHRPAHHEPGGLQQAGTEGEAVGAVVVAGDHHHRDLQLEDQRAQHQVEQAHRLGRRHRAVVDVAGEQDGVGPGVGGDAHELLQHVGLVFEQGDAVIDTAEMPVGGVEEAHRERDRGRGRSKRRCRAGIVLQRNPRCRTSHRRPRAYI